MEDSPVLLPPAEFKDRSGGLKVFGILEILLGCLCALLVPLVVLGQVMSARATQGPLNLRLILPGAMAYVLLAVAFVWLGIGSIRRRRWARALLLVLSWSWLGTGVMAVGFLLFLAPEMMKSLPAGVKEVALFVSAVIWLTIFIVIPGALVAFYQSRHVKATCEAHDPVAGWTDTCPLPVFGVSLWLGFGALMLMMMPVVYGSVLPCFGVLLSGPAGAVTCLALTALWVWLAWAWYRLKPAAWWITLSTILVFLTSNLITFARIDLMDMYRLMGYPPEQIEQLQRFNFFTGQTMVWWSALFMLPVILYLFWVKRFFPTHGLSATGGGVAAD